MNPATFIGKYKKNRTKKPGNLKFLVTALNYFQIALRGTKRNQLHSGQVKRTPIDSIYELIV